MKKITRTRHEMKNIVKEAKLKSVMELSLSNEGHAFYTTYVEPEKSRILITRFGKAVSFLNKMLPGGTFTFTIDGLEQ
jgi:hypothetical protein